MLLRMTEVIRTKHSDYTNDLKRSGLKNTKHRTSILAILEQNDQPISAEKIYNDLQTRGVSVNLSTVYRTLDSLNEKCLVNKLNISGDGRTLYEFNHKVHRHYLLCLECKTIIPISDCPLKNYEQVVEEKTNFKVEGHNLNIYGYCLECQKKSKPGV